MTDQHRSEAIKAGLARAKVGGKKLGNPDNLSSAARHKGAEVRAAKAHHRAKLILPVAKSYLIEMCPKFDPATDEVARAFLDAPSGRGSKLKLSYEGLAIRLKKAGIPAPNGRAWYAFQVKRSLERLV